MSIWGTGVFAGDGAMDIRDTYRGLLLDKVPDGEAATRTLDMFADELADPDDGGSFAIALAVTMHKVGRLTEAVKALAMAALDAGPEDWWTGAKDKRARERVFDATRALPMSEQPPPKRLSRPWEENTSLAPGDVLALETNQGYGLLRVARLAKTRFGASPVVVTLDYRGPTLPGAEVLDATPDLALLSVRWGSGPPLQVDSVGKLVSRPRKRDPDFADVGFRVIGHVDERPGDDDLEVGGGCMWDGAAESLTTGSWFASIEKANAFANEVEHEGRP